MAIIFECLSIIVKVADMMMEKKLNGVVAVLQAFAGRALLIYKNDDNCNFLSNIQLISNVEPGLWRSEKAYQWWSQRAYGGKIACPPPNSTENMVMVICQILGKG